MTHILIPREPNPALLRPFISCPEGQLPEAWAAMVRAAEVQNARAGRSCLAQIQEPAAVTGPVPSDEAIEDFLAPRVSESGRVPMVKTIREALTHFSAPALEAPAAPIQHQGMTIAGNGASELGKLMRAQRDSRMGVYPDGNPNAGTRADLLAAAPQAPAAPVYPAKFGPDDWIMVVAGIPVKRDEWSPGAVKARTIYGTSAVSAVDASDTALLDAMERHRIALVPEFEGPWDAELYEEGEEPQHIGSGATPREALCAALVTHLQGSGAAISTVRENSAWPLPHAAAQAKKGGA